MNIEEYEKIKEQRTESVKKMNMFETLSREKNAINGVIRILEKDLKIEVLELYVRSLDVNGGTFIEHTKINDEMIRKLKDLLIIIKNEAEKQIEEI